MSVCPQAGHCRGKQWDFHPSGFLLLLQTLAFRKAPSLHTVMDSRFTFALRLPGGLPRLLGCSFHARCPHPPRNAQRVLCLLLPHWWQASSQSADWPPSFSYRGRIGFTFVTAHVFASPVRQPHFCDSRSFGYMSNRQFTWVSATGRCSAIKGRLPAHFRLIFNRVEMVTCVQGTGPAANPSTAGKERS